MDPATQHQVVFDDPDGRSVPDPAGDGRAAFLAWHADTLEDERRAADRPDDPRAPYSGYWWSTPALSELRRSIGSLQSTGPVGLHLVEDAFIWRSARCWSLELRPCASIFEIGGTDDWAELVRRYPLAVTKSRRHDWWRATGSDLDWAIPDFHALRATTTPSTSASRDISRPPAEPYVPARRTPFSRDGTPTPRAARRPQAHTGTDRMLGRRSARAISGGRMLKAIVRNTPVQAANRDAGGRSAAAATK